MHIHHMERTCFFHSCVSHTILFTSTLGGISCIFSHLLRQGQLAFLANEASRVRVGGDDSRTDDDLGINRPVCFL